MLTTTLLLRKSAKQGGRKLCSLSTRAGTIEFSLSRSSRRRTIEISVDDSMEVRVAAPRYVLQEEVCRFIREKAGWISEKLEETRQVQERLKERKYTNGHKFLFLGKKYSLEIIEADIRKPQISFDGLKWTARVPGQGPGEDPQLLVKDKLVSWYRTQAKEIFGGRVFHYARILGLEPREVAVKTQKRIWGSCNHRGKTINLNWHLVLAPMKVIDYVIVHELCHLEVPSHSRRFWRKVQEIIPDYRQSKNWLKANSIDMTLP